MIDEVVAGVLVEAISAIGRRLSTMAALGSRRYAGDLAIARWFDTYRLTDIAPTFEQLSPAEAILLEEVLRSDEVQAVLQELLAARLTDAPEADVNRVRTTFLLTLMTSALTAGKSGLARHGFFGAGGPPAHPIDIDVGSVATVLFDYYDDQIATLVGRLEGAEPALLQQVRSEALVARMIAILHAIERHTAALSNRPDQRTETDFIARYWLHIAEHHGKIEPPDFERRRRVPVDDLYIPPPIIRLTGKQADHPSHELDLPTLAGEIDRTVLLGDPGSGKTTAANVLMYRHTRNKGSLIPFLVTLREFASKDSPERSVVGHIEHKLETFYQCPPPTGLVITLLLSGRALVIFDGLDELLDTTRRAEITAIVERFCSEYPLTRVLATSRLVGYDQARLDDSQFIRYRIGEFSDTQVDEYVRKWFAQEQGIDPEPWADAFLDESASVPDLRTNPLMLALMCILYRGEGSLPRSRAEVYEQCASLLFRKWDARRRIHMALRAGRLVEPTLRHLAWWLFTRGEVQPAVTERELVNQTTSFFERRGFEPEEEAREAAIEFVDFCRGRMWVFSDTGTTATGESQYSFTHRTFLEYFAAAHLAYGSDAPEQLADTLVPHVAGQEWEVTGELAIQIKDHTSDLGAERIYTALLGRSYHSAADRSGILQFLARSLRSVDPPPQTIKRLTREVLNHLFADDINDSVGYLPLSWLLISCSNCMEIVSDEITNEIGSMVQSSDREHHLNGLRLALWLPMCLTAGGGSRFPSDSPLSNFWQDRTTENTQTYANAIVAAANRDFGLRYGALLGGLITTEKALEMPDGRLALFQVQPAGIFGVSMPPYLPAALSTLVLGNTRYASLTGRDASSRAIDNLAAFGRHLIDHAQPPWVKGSVDPWLDFLWEDITDTNFAHLQRGSLSYFGAIMTILIEIEFMEAVTLPNKRNHLGAISELRPYIAQRRGVQPTSKLSELPIPYGFKQVLYDWAGKKVDFVERADTSDL